MGWGKKKANYKRPTEHLPMVYNPHSSSCCIPSTTFFPGQDFVQAAFIDPGLKNTAIRIIRYYFKIGSVEVIHMGLYRFAPDLMVETACNASVELLRPIIDDFRMCHHILIEHQVRDSIVNNRICQHLISYLMPLIRNHGVNGQIAEIDSKLKIQGLGGPPISKTYYRKKWCKEKAKELLTERGDKQSLEFIFRRGDKKVRRDYQRKERFDCREGRRN